MQICILILILAFIMLVADIIVFIKIKKMKEEVLENFKTITDEPDVFYDFFK